MSQETDYGSDISLGLGGSVPSSDYGSGLDWDALDVEVSAAGDVRITAELPAPTVPPPVSEDPMSQDSGSSYVYQSSSSPEPSSEDLEQLTLGDNTRMEAAEVTQAVKDRIRALCQSVRSDETARRREHEDGKALARRILSKLTTTTEGWCELSTLKPTKEGGYIQLSHGGANKFAMLQEVCLWAKGEAKPASGEQTDPNDVSHLCDQPACTVLSHVCVESKEQNNSRKGCLGSIRCVDSCGRCHSSLAIWFCPHEPPCIRYVEGYASFEDWKANGVCTDRSAEAERAAKRARPT